MLTLIPGGEVYRPEPAGKASVLAVGEKIARVGPVEGAMLARLDVPVRTLSAEGCYVVPGFLDPHSHLIGAGGESGYSTRMPEISFDALVRAGITTVVGCLGTDSVTRT